MKGPKSRPEDRHCKGKPLTKSRRYYSLLTVETDSSHRTSIPLPSRDRVEKTHLWYGSLERKKPEVQSRMEYMGIFLSKF